MSTFTIEIHPKKAEFDPLAAQVKRELIEIGEEPKTAAVETRRLFRIEGNLTARDIETVAHTLLVDPIVETATIESAEEKPKKAKPSKKEKPGLMVDVWPKPGVTDPVGETIEKGLRDLGIFGNNKATSAQRYVFPKLKDARNVKTLAKRVLANELIHVIDIRKPH